MACLAVKILKVLATCTVFDHDGVVVTVVGHVLQCGQETDRLVNVRREGLRQILNQRGPLEVRVDREVGQRRAEYVQDEAWGWHSIGITSELNNYLHYSATHLDNLLVDHVYIASIFGEYLGLECDEVIHQFVLKDTGGLEGFTLAELWLRSGAIHQHVERD